MITVNVPKFGEMTTEVVLVEWLVAPGDSVAAGAPLLVLETDKVDAEVEAPSAGVVVELHAEVGAEVEVGVALCTIETEA